MNINYWLMKSEPTTYSIDDLIRDQITPWEGVRNYQARNFMRDQMKINDKVLFYHSNTKPPSVTGLAKICRLAYPDHFAWDPQSNYYDPKSSPNTPIWMMVDIKFIKKFTHFVSLDELKLDPNLQDMMVIKRGTRLSIQPITKENYDHITTLGN
jgi:predicted RNA-binding protein with PUA-like domain